MIFQPLASAPSLSSALSTPMDSGSWYATLMRRSTRSKYGSRSGRHRAVERRLAAPALEDALGRAPRHAAVDDGRAADRTAFLEQHRRIADGQRRAGVAVQRLHHARRLGGEVARGVVAALLEHHHVEPALGQLGGQGGAAGPGADDDDVTVERGRAVQLLADREPTRQRRGGIAPHAWARRRGGRRRAHDATALRRGRGGRSGSGASRAASWRARSSPYTRRRRALTSLIHAAGV
jgi:hypothetical protein